MTSHDKGRALPKFGEWDVNNPSSADGFTVIFAKARDEKKANGMVGSDHPPRIESTARHDTYASPKKKGGWLCCF